MSLLFPTTIKWLLKVMHEPPLHTWLHINSMTNLVSKGVSVFTGGFAVQKARLSDGEDGGVSSPSNHQHRLGVVPRE